MQFIRSIVNHYYSKNVLNCFPTRKKAHQVRYETTNALFKIQDLIGSVAVRGAANVRSKVRFLASASWLVPMKTTHKLGSYPFTKGNFLGCSLLNQIFFNPRRFNIQVWNVRLLRLHCNQRIYKFTKLVTLTILRICSKYELRCVRISYFFSLYFSLSSSLSASFFYIDLLFFSDSSHPLQSY